MPDRVETKYNKKGKEQHSIRPRYRTARSETEKDRDREREKEKDRDREREKEKDRQRERERERERESKCCGQSYKASTIVIYESRVVNQSNLIVTTTLEL